MARLIESMPTYKDEVEHEKEMRNLGSHRTNKRLQSHIEREEESVTSYGKVMVANTIRPLANAIGEWLQEQSKKTIGAAYCLYENV